MENNSKTIKEKFYNDPLNFIKEHYTLVLIIPTLLGGIWQLIELISIDISFVRFFSITQLIQDGILFLCFEIMLGIILFILILISFIPFLIFRDINKIFKLINLHRFKAKINEDGCTSLKKTNLFITFIFLISIFFPIVYLFSQIEFFTPQFSILNDRRSFLNKFLLKSVFVSASFIIYFFFSELVESEIEESKRVYSKAGYFNLCCMLGMYFFFNTIFFIKYFSNYENLKNYSLIEKEIINKDMSVLQTKILYLNDKYLFLLTKKTSLINDKIENEIEVLKIDDLFQNKTLIESDLENKNLKDSIAKLNLVLKQNQIKLDSLKFK